MSSFGAIREAADYALRLAAEHATAADQTKTASAPAPSVRSDLGEQIRKVACACRDLPEDMSLSEVNADEPLSAILRKRANDLRAYNATKTASVHETEKTAAAALILLSETPDGQ